MKNISFKQAQTCAVSLVFAVFFFSLFSCNNEKKILGEWKNETLQKTELLSEQGNFESLFAYAYIQKMTEFSFFQDGTFKKSVAQKVKKVDYLSEENPMRVDFSDEETFYTLEGTFFVSFSTLIFNCERATVKIGNTEIEFSEEELETQNFLPEAREQTLPYKISGSTIKIWDFVVNGYLDYEKKTYE